MNIWKLTFATTKKAKLNAIVIALTPNEARTIVRKLDAVDPIECKQLGAASSSFRVPEILMNSLDPL